MPEANKMSTFYFRGSGRWIIAVGFVLIILLLFAGLESNSATAIQSAISNSVVPAQEPSQPPVLFFSDLKSGPASGNSDTTYGSNGGVYVNLYGNFFGTTQGSSTVSLGSISCLRVISWGMSWNWYQKITVQLTPTCLSGNFIVTTDKGKSNGLPFTITSGKVFYVSPNGKDSNNGSFSRPWMTVPHAVQTAGTKAGNIIYAENGVTAAKEDGEEWEAALTLKADWCRGTAAEPDVLAAYPGASVQIGSSNSRTPGYGLRTTDSSAGGGACSGYWTFAGINFRGGSAISVNGPSQYWRFVANDISNAQNSGENGGGAAFEFGQASHNEIFGNHLHDLNLATTDRLQQGLYLSTDANHSDVGWNLLANAKGRALLQTHSSPLSSGNGFVLYDIRIHDNMIHGAAEECILVDTVDPSKGAILVFNNVLWDCGRDGSGSDSQHMQLSGDFDHAQGVGSGWIEWYNNTVYCESTEKENCWGSGYVDIHDGRGAFNSVHNELLYSNGEANYWAVGATPWNPSFYCEASSSSAECPTFRGSNNLVFNHGAPTYTRILLANFNIDPMFVNLRGRDFHLQLNSAAHAKGITAWDGVNAPAYDIEGRLRGSPPSVGAYE
jgi:hypothetical protein